MDNQVFTAMSSTKITQILKTAQTRVVLAAPAVFKSTAESLIDTAKRIGKDQVTVIVDCDEEVFRLGYGEFDAVKALSESGLEVRQAPGLRLGVLICDNSAWTFAPTALYVQAEIHSDETPNAMELLGTDIDRIIASIVCNTHSATSSSRDKLENAEIGQEPVTEQDISSTSEALRIAPPVPFDIARQVRVFQPYIQYVEISLKGCSIQRKRVKIPKFRHKSHIKDIEDRLQTTFELIEKNSVVSSNKLEQELNIIREELTRSLGKPWGRVLLKAARPLFDDRIREFGQHLEEHKSKIKREIRQHLEHSKDQVVNYYLPQFEKDPPDRLRGQLLCPNPTQDDIRVWLRGELDRAFPKPEELVTDIRLDIQYRDVTYETLCEKGFFDALRAAYPNVNWYKPFDEFNAAKEKPWR